MKIFKSIFVGIIISVLANLAWFEYASASGFVELSFTLNNKYYNSKGMQKTLEAAPFIEKESTMVPFRVILEELGYTIDWNERDSTIKAVSENSTIILRINNNIAIVNDVEKEMIIAPKIVNGKTVVPLRFISENANCSVSWDAPTKTISISRVGKFDTGKIMLYERKSGDKNVVHVYDGRELKAVALTNNSLVNWYSYKGKVLATIFDKTKNQNHFTIFKEDSFVTLINDFDVKDTFEYNDSLLIHGYDRTNKFNKLYRFDGQKLILVQNNFYIGKNFLFKDKLIVNKYDNTRNYSLVVFDRNSWNPNILASGFILKENLEYDGTMYMTGTWQQGSDMPLVSYDGNGTSSSNFIIINANINLSLSKTAMHNKKLYAVYNGELVNIEKNKINKIYIPYNYSVYVKYNVIDIELYNNKLIIATSGGQFVDLNGKSVAAPKIGDQSIRVPACIIEFEDQYKVKNLINEFSLSEFKLEKNILLFVGSDRLTRDYIMYVYNGLSLFKTLDVTKIKQSLTINNNVFIDVNDKDRMTNKTRNTLILFDGQSFKNLAVGMEIKNWSVVGENLIISGYEDEINAYRLYSYTNSFNKLLNNYNIKYWKESDNSIFINGFDGFDKNYTLFKFAGSKLSKINENIEISNMVKTKGKYYLIYAYNRDPKSELNSKRVLYLYNDISKKFIEMKTNADISQMIFVD